MVKAERAKGGNVIYAHAGDLISPSLLSGLDQGEHTIALTNMAPPDIFTPGNHEFDFGAAGVPEAHERGEVPALRRQPAHRGRTSRSPASRTREIRDVGGLKVGIVGLTAEDSPVKSSPGDNLVFAPTFDTAMAPGARISGRKGADLVVAVVHANRAVDLKLYRQRRLRHHPRRATTMTSPCSSTATRCWPSR